MSAPTNTQIPAVRLTPRDGVSPHYYVDMRPLMLVICLAIIVALGIFMCVWEFRARRNKDQADVMIELRDLESGTGRSRSVVPNTLPARPEPAHTSNNRYLAVPRHTFTNPCRVLKRSYRREPRTSVPEIVITEPNTEPRGQGRGFQSTSPAGDGWTDVDLSR